MKYLKMLGLAAVAAMALTVFLGAGSAAGTVLCKVSTATTGCSGSGQDYSLSTTIEASSLGTGVLATIPGTVLDECINSTIKGKTTRTGSSTETVTFTIEELNWGTCTKTTDTIKNGELEIHWISGTDNGTVTDIGTEWTVFTVFGTCGFTVSDIGTLVGGNPAKISIVQVVVKRTFGLCPSEELWTDEFAITNPKPLYVSTN